MSLARCRPVSCQRSPRAAKYSPGPPPPSPRTAPRAQARRRAVPGMVLCTVRVQPLHPVPAPVAPRRCAGCTPSRKRGAAAAPRPPSYPQLAAGVGVRWLHPVARGVRTACPVLSSLAPGRELVLPHADVGCRQVVADHGEVQVPALGPPVGPLDPSGHDVRIAWLDDARGLQPVQAGPHRPLRQAGVADQRGHRRERPGAVRAGVVGQADEHGLARAGWLAAAVGRDRGQVQRPGDRLDAHRAPPGRREAPPPAAQPVVSLFVSFIPVRSRSPANADLRAAQVGYTPDRWWMYCAVLESV